MRLDSRWNCVRPFVTGCAAVNCAACINLMTSKPTKAIFIQRCFFVKELIKSLAQCHCIVPLHSATTQCHCTVPLHSTTAQCHCTVPLHSATAQCHYTVPLHSATTQCHCTVPLHSATAQCHYTVPLPLVLSFVPVHRYKQTICFASTLTKQLNTRTRT